MSSPLKTISSEDGVEGSYFAMMTKTLFYISESLTYICINPDVVVERLKLFAHAYTSPQIHFFDILNLEELSALLLHM